MCLTRYKTITVVGSRKAPQEAIEKAITWLQKHSDETTKFRSGNAPGFDQAIRAFPCDQHVVYLPYRGFGAKLEGNRGIFPKSLGTDYDIALEIVHRLHPLGKNVPLTALPYLVRDVYQVLGADCKHPTDIVLCWTPDGAQSARECTRDTGGTGMAIRVADAYGIPIVNLNHISKVPKQVYLDKMDTISDNEVENTFKTLRKVRVSCSNSTNISKK